MRILCVALVVTAVAFAFASIATPHYKAETHLLIETRESVFTRPDGTADNDKPILDEEGVTSQVEVDFLHRHPQAGGRKLDLARLPEFDEAADMSSLGRLLVIVGLKSDPGEFPPEERVLKTMREKLNVYRVEKSRVIVIEFSSQDPRLAPKSRTPSPTPTSPSRATPSCNRIPPPPTGWRRRSQTCPSGSRMPKPRSPTSARSPTCCSGRTIRCWPRSSFPSCPANLSRVRANRAAAEATAESVRKALQSGGSLDAFPEVLSSDLIQRLRERQVQLKTDIADLSTTLLDNHPRIRALRRSLPISTGRSATRPRRC